MFCRNVGSANTAAGNCFICPVYILLCFANSWNYENLFKQEIQTRNNLVLKESHGICYTLNEINPHNCFLVITSVCVCVCVCAYAYDAHFPSGKARSHWVRKRTAFKSEHSAWRALEAINLGQYQFKRDSFSHSFWIKSFVSSFEQKLVDVNFSPQFHSKSGKLIKNSWKRCKLITRLFRLEIALIVAKRAIYSFFDDVFVLRVDLINLNKKFETNWSLRA